MQLQSTYCADNAGWACNELGILYRLGAVVAKDEMLASAYFSQSCELKFQAGCLNLLAEDRFASADPRPLDLRLLLREGSRNSFSGRKPISTHGPVSTTGPLLAVKADLRG